MAEIQLDVRQTQVLYQVGVGALVQIGGQSFVPCDIRYWRQQGQEVFIDRLKRELHGKRFYKAPVYDDQNPFAPMNGRIPVVRFPRWMYCPQCRKIYAYPRSESRPQEPIICSQKECRQAESALAPMPWVMICKKGHMTDLQWDYLLHRQGQNQKQETCHDKEHLFYRPASEQNPVAKIECVSCKASLPLSGIKDPNFLKRIKCYGKHPWLPVGEGEHCDAHGGDGSLVVAGLGDLFVHYPVVVSALAIPPESRIHPDQDLRKKLLDHPQWTQVSDLFRQHGRENGMVVELVESIAFEVEVDPDVVWDFLDPPPLEDNIEDNQPLVSLSNSILQDEYIALRTRIDDFREHEQFITVSKTEEWQAFLSNGECEERAREAGEKITEIVGATRLREVRAYRGFTRIKQLFDDDVIMVPADLDESQEWLPVGEFFGEGVFLIIDRDALKQWVMRTAVQTRTETVRGLYEASAWSTRLGIHASTLPVFIVLHTLAHLLIREMSFECGYPAASLRERLYFSEAGEACMTGLLVYLAAGEPGGSLGGLAELTDPERFLALLMRCVEKARWCSYDPVCAEHEGRGDPPLNRAACHACCLLPETCCEYSNLLLDRSLIAAMDAGSDTGFFDAREG